MKRIRSGFTIDGKKYSYIKSDKFNIEDLKLKSEKYKGGYLSIGVAFDIETTSYYSIKHDRELATMYVWQLGINKDTIIGRTWTDFVLVLEQLNKYAESKNGTILCLVHNLSFEFQFIKSIFDWNKNKDGYPDIFAKDDRTILYARWKNIEFRDTLALTSMPLSSFKKNFGLSIGKLKGDLDYSLLRHSKTNINKQELAYCINDVQILTEFFHKYIEETYLKNKKQIPLTSTGIVRAEIKEEFNKMDKESKRKMLRRIQNAQPSEAMYKFMRQFVFRGGYVHANTTACNYLWEESFDSYDLKSAHPAQMLQRKFSWKYNKRNKSQFPKVLELARTNDYGFLGIFKFYNICCSGFHSLESKNKIIDASLDAVYENGRLVCASWVKVGLIHTDFFNYEDLYTWDRYECTVLYQAKLEPLPDYVRKIVLKYFTLKETLPKDSLEYMLSKRKLNSCFGMAATSLPVHELIFNEDLNEFEASAISRTYDELTRYLIMLPQWAIEIAAYTRRDIVKSVKACGFDSMYYDTDSNKIKNPQFYKDFFENFNKEKMEANEAMEVYDFDRSLFSRIGCFEKEYTGTRFKVLGAKRYLVEHNGEIQCTVAGMVKGSLEEYCIKKQIEHIQKDIPNHVLYEIKDFHSTNIETYKSALIREIYTYMYEQEKHPLIWDLFNDGLELPAGESKKKTTVYYDQQFSDILTDYEGNTSEVYEGSCVAIIDIPFTMSMELEFINRIEAMRVERERMIHKGVF